MSNPSVLQQIDRVVSILHGGIADAEALRSRVQSSSPSGTLTWAAVAGLATPAHRAEIKRVSLHEAGHVVWLALSEGGCSGVAIEVQVRGGQIVAIGGTAIATKAGPYSAPLHASGLAAEELFGVYSGLQSFEAGEDDLKRVEEAQIKAGLAVSPRRAVDRAKGFLSVYRNQVWDVASALQERGQLSASEIDRILQGEAPGNGPPPSDPMARRIWDKFGLGHQL